MARNICSETGCGRFCHSRGFCQRHYNRIKRTVGFSNTNSAKPCEIEGCLRPQAAKGVCASHRQRNLELWSHSQPRGQEIEDKLKWAESLIQQYKNPLGWDGDEFWLC